MYVGGGFIHCEQPPKTTWTRYEKNLSTRAPQTSPHSWLSRAHEIKRGSQSNQGTSQSRPPAIGAQLISPPTCAGHVFRTQALRPALRLRRSADFTSVLNQGSRYSDAAFHLYYRANTFRLPRLGLAVSKRVSNRAHERNYLKRLLRETFRRLSTTLPPLDLVVLVRPGASATPPSDIRERFTKALRAICSRSSPCSTPQR